jgi:voltage-gated potassium channel
MKLGTIHPESKFKILWDFFILLATIAVTIQAPLMIIFDLQSTGFLFAFDLVITLVFIADIIIAFNTGYIVKRQLVTDRKLIAREYLKFWFWPDLLATIPLFALSGTNVLILNRLFRFFRLSRLLKLFTGARTIRKAKELNINPSIMRMVLMVFWLLIASHLIACGFVFINGVSPDQPNSMRYLQAFYWTVTTLATIGYGDITPNRENPIQLIFTIFTELIGVGTYGFIIGNISTLIANIDVAKTQYREKMEKINTFLKYRNIPGPLQKRISDYYDYLWESRRGYDESMVLEDLPTSLKTQVSLFLNKDIIEKVPIFKGASTAFIKEIIMNMIPVVYTPGDYIVVKGEIGDEMYFINTGSVDVVSEDEQVVYATLSAGQFFGEIALLLSMPRTATIKARDYCDLYSLEKDTFDRILIRYPGFAKSIEELADQRRKENQEKLQKQTEAKGIGAADVLPVNDSAENDGLPGKVVGMIAQKNEEGLVDLYWEEAKDCETYTVLRKNDVPGGKWQIIAAGVESNTATDRKPPAGGVIQYRVRGENRKGSGPWSEVVTLNE